MEATREEARMKADIKPESSGVIAGSEGREVDLKTMGADWQDPGYFQYVRLSVVKNVGPSRMRRWA